jgi:GT2 family glycosyltransferase
VRFDTLDIKWPLVSVVIPTGGNVALLQQCVNGILHQTDYENIEIIILYNTSTRKEVFPYFKEISADRRVTIVDSQSSFNFSRICNMGIKRARGDIIGLINDDIEVIESGWLKEMVSCFNYPETGIVGARLLYPDRHLQHAGVIVGLGGLAGHWFSGQPETFPGPMGRLHVRESLTAVTAACMLVSRGCLAAVGDFDEELFPVAYNDVDFCLRSVTKGFRVVWTPFATLIHHESMTRGSDKTPANYTRFESDKNSLRQRHNTETFEDRAFSPWYSRDQSLPSVLLLLDQLPKAR